MSDWTAEFVGDRMTVDQAFNEQVTASAFTHQEWGTIMTAVDFEIEGAETPATAELVANTEDVDQILPALDEIEQQRGAMSPGGGGPTGDTGGGILDTLTDRLGLGGGDDDEDDRLAAAEGLADAYAEAFQEHLEDEGKWERACSLAAEE